jgi:hypothetical protein
MDPHQRRPAMVQIAHAESYDLLRLAGFGEGKSEDSELPEAAGKIRLSDLSKLGCRGHYDPRRKIR